MNSSQLLNKFSLSKANGWQAIDFPLANKDSFYTFMIEHHDLSLAWVAISNNQSLKEFKQHYFQRVDPIETGEKNFLPRILIVYNGKRWYAADMTMNHFVACKEEDILTLIVNELKKVSLYYSLLKRNPKRIKEMNETITQLVKEKGLIAGSFTSFVKSNLADDNGFDLLSDDPDKDIVIQFQKRNKALENACDILSKEFTAQNNLLHSMLISQCSLEQLESLTQIRGLYNYVNPWVLGIKGILVKLIESDPFGKNNGIEGKSKGYFVIDINGQVKPIKIRKEEQSVKFTNGFFRLNINALKKLR